MAPFNVPKDPLSNMNYSNLTVSTSIEKVLRPSNGSCGKKKKKRKKGTLLKRLNHYKTSSRRHINVKTKEFDQKFILTINLSYSCKLFDFGETAVPGTIKCSFT